jgi:hypothetical protein
MPGESFGPVRHPSIRDFRQARTRERGTNRHKTAQRFRDWKQRLCTILANTNDDDEDNNNNNIDNNDSDDKRPL